MSVPVTPARSRWFAFLFVLLAGVAVLGPAASNNAAVAQDDAPAGKPAAKAAPNLIVHMINSVGWVFGPLLLLVSISLVALCVMLALDLRMSVAIPPGFVDEFTDTVNKRRFKEAFEMAKNDTSFLGRVLTAGMSRLQYGLEDAREAAMNMLESIRSDKEQKINYTAVIGTLGPLLGLVGTVFGMIQAFIKLSGGTRVEPQELSGDISHALVVTLFGVAISVPAIFFNAFFRNRTIRLSMDTGHIADDLLTQMYHNSKKAGGTAERHEPVGAAGRQATAADGARRDEGALSRIAHPTGGRP